MKFYVNDACIGCGLCAASCPEVFKMNDQDLAQATEDEVDAAAEDAALEAQENCPVDAIDLLNA